VVGVTTNPSIFQAAITGSDDYAADIARLARRGRRGADRAGADHRRRAPRLRAVPARSGRPPTARTAGSRSRSTPGSPTTPTRPSPRPGAVGRGGPAQPAHQDPGHPGRAARDPGTIAAGISVNVTLLFSVDRYRRSWTPTTPGSRTGSPPASRSTGVHSVASFFVSRVDTAIDPLLAELGTEQASGAAGHRRGRQRPAGLRRLPRGRRQRPVAGAGGAGWRTRSGRCGPRPGSRTPTTRRPSTSPSWSPPARSTPCLRPRSTPSPREPVTADTITQPRPRPRHPRRAHRARHRPRPGHRPARGRGRHQVRAGLDRAARHHR
jgi:hypothetical protein